MPTIYTTEVIISHQERRGTGSAHDPIRAITQVYSKEGELIAEYDPQPTTFSAMDLVHFENWQAENGKCMATIEDVYKWLDRKL